MTQLKVVSAGAVCSVLHEDPDLAEAVPHDRREQAISELSARELRLPAGPWSGDRLPVVQGGVGLLMLSGMMIRRVGLKGRYGAELLGECDILRPWPGEDGGSATLATTTGWASWRHPGSRYSTFSSPARWCTIRNSWADLSAARCSARATWPSIWQSSTRRVSTSACTC